MLRSDRCAGDPGWADCGASPSGLRREGDRVGEEKESRYRAIKKSSFSAQQAKRTL